MNAKTVINIAPESCQSLFIEMRFNETPLSTGTAFVMLGRSGTPHLITNRHNVTGRHQETGEALSDTKGLPNNLFIWHHKQSALGQWVPGAESLEERDSPLWIEHPTMGGAADFVALPLTDLNNVQLYPYPSPSEAPTLTLGVADSVSVIGFPFGMSAGLLFGVWATGFLASEPNVDAHGRPIQLIDCRSRPGQSGSPVIAKRSQDRDEDGNTRFFAGPVTKLVGIYSGRIHPESDLGIVWKAKAIAELLDVL